MFYKIFQTKKLRPNLLSKSKQNIEVYKYIKITVYTYMETNPATAGKAPQNITLTWNAQCLLFLVLSGRWRCLLKLLLNDICMILNNFLDNWRVGQSWYVAELIRLVSWHLAQDATHDLARPRLGQAFSELQEQHLEASTDGITHRDGHALLSWH